MHPAVLILAALRCTLRGCEGEPRVVGEGDARERDVDLHFIREAVDSGPVAVILRLEALRLLGGLAAAPVPVVEGVLEGRVSAAQEGRAGEVPGGLASVPVSAEDLDQSLDTRRIEGVGLDPGDSLHLSYLKVSTWSNCLEDSPTHARVSEAKNLQPLIFTRK